MAGYPVLTVEDAGEDVDSILNALGELVRTHEAYQDGYLAVFLDKSVYQRFEKVRHNKVEVGHIGSDSSFPKFVSGIENVKGKRFSVSHFDDTTDTGKASLYSTEDGCRLMDKTTDLSASKEKDEYAEFSDEFSSWKVHRSQGTNGKPTKKYFKDKYDFDVKFYKSIEFR